MKNITKVLILLFIGGVSLATILTYSHNQVKQGLYRARILSASGNYNEAVRILQSVQSKWATPSLRQEISITLEQIRQPDQSGQETLQDTGAEAKAVDAKGVVNIDGTTTNFVLHFLSTGGGISGSSYGFCSGEINGNFNAQTTVISGNMTGSCSSLSVPASGSFTGNMYLTQGSGNGNFEGKSAFISRSGPWTASFTPLQDQ